MVRKKYMHMVIMVLLTFAISLAPTFGQVTRVGMQTLGVFIGVLYGWISFDLIIPSLYGFTMLGFFQLMTSTTALSIGFGNTNLVVVIVGMVMVGALDSVGVTRVIANWLVTREIFRKSPWLMIAGMLFSAYVMGMIALNLVAAFLLWAVVMQIAQENNIPHGDKLLTFMILMIVASAFSGVFSVPFRATALIFESYFIDTMQMNFAVIPFILISVATTGLVLILMCMLGRFVFKLDASKFIMADHIVEELRREKASTEAKVGIAVIIVYTLMILLPSLFPNMPGAAVLTSMGFGGCACLAMVVLAAVAIKGRTVLELGRVWQKYVDWQLILLLAVTFPIADAMRASEAGIMPTIIGAVLPVVSSMGVTKFMIVSMLFLGILTQVTHNIVLAAMFTQFLCPLCAQIGGNPYIMWFLMYFALNASYMTPAASFQSAMVHGHEAIKSRYAYIFGISFSILTWLVLIIVTIPLGEVLF